MDNVQREKIVKFYIEAMKTSETDDLFKYSMLLELDSSGPIFNFLLYNIFNNISNRFIQRACVIMMNDKYLRVIFDNNKKWFEEDDQQV